MFKEIVQEAITKICRANALVLLDSTNISIILISIDAVGKKKNKQAVDKLVALTKHENSDIRKGAAQALGRIRDPKAIMELFALLDDETPVRNCAAAAICKTASKDIGLLKKVLEIRNFPLGGPFCAMIYKAAKKEKSAALVAPMLLEIALAEYWKMSQRIKATDALTEIAYESK
jgi:hypothetical protein